MTIRTSHLVTVAVILFGTAVCHGYWSNRWASLTGGDFDPDVLASIDAKIGDWEGGEVATLQEGGQRPYSMARRFTNHQLGKSVTVSFISGVPGKVATHTPDVCYPGSGFKMRTDIKSTQIPLGEGKSADFYVSEFQKTTASGSDALRVRWTWTRDGSSWVAPKSPRWEFGRAAVIHKLYVVHPVGEDDTTDERVYEAFAADLCERLGARLKR